MAFLAQLGRDHRKYGVTQQAITTPCRTHCCAPRHAPPRGRAWDDRLAEATRDAVELIVGGRRGAADAEKGPALPRREPSPTTIRATRDVSIGPAATRPPALLPPRAVRHRRGSAVAAAMALSEPRRYRPTATAPSNSTSDRCAGGTVSTAIVGETSTRRPLANVQPARRIARRPRRCGDVLMVAGSTGPAPLRRADHGP